MHFRIPARQGWRLDGLLSYRNVRSKVTPAPAFAGNICRATALWRWCRRTTEH